MKQKIFVLLLLISIIFLCHCNFKESVNENILGTWKMIKVKELSKDVTERHNPDNDRWISFIEDRNIDGGGIFESGKGDLKENSGKWFYNEKENELYLDSDAGEDDDSYWSVTIEGSRMIWKGRRFEFNKRFEIEYSRVL